MKNNITKAVSLNCPITDISPRCDKLANDRTGYITLKRKVHQGLLIQKQAAYFR